MMRWLKIAVVLEVLLGTVIGLFVLFNVMTIEEAKAVAVKVTVAIVVLAVAGAVVGAVMARPDAQSPKE